MKRSAGSEFDEEGDKWFQSPHYKEGIHNFFSPFLYIPKVKTNAVTGTLDDKDVSKRIPREFEKDLKIKRERFYDLFSRVTRECEFKLDVEELNRTLNIRIEEIPDNYKVSAIFEELNSKSSVIARGKKNWSEQETMLLIWLVIAHSTIEDKDYNDLVTTHIEIFHS